MKTLDLKVTVADDGKVSLNFPVNMPAGEYKAVLILEDHPIPSIKSTSLHDAQILFRQYVPEGRKLSEELIRDRREEILHLT